MANDESGTISTNKMLWIQDHSLKFVIEAIDIEAIMTGSTMVWSAVQSSFFAMLIINCR